MGMTPLMISVEHRISRKKGILILHQNTTDHFVLGAGTDFGNGGDDFYWMDIWRVFREPRIEVLDMQNPVDGYIQLNSPGIFVAKSESASGVVYWNGKAYIWVQTGD